MSKIARFFLGALLLLVASSASALLPQVDTFCRNGQQGNMCGSKDTRASAYEAWLNTPGLRGTCSEGTYAGAPPPATVYVTSDTATNLGLNFWTPSCWGGGRYDNTGGGLIGSFSRVGSQCPANSTAVTGGCQCTAPYIEQGGQCVDPNQACEAGDGELRTVNFTLGWARSPTVDAPDYLGPMSLPNREGAPCVSGCRAQFTETPVIGVWRSQEPSAQGLYRISGDWELRMGNVACTPGTSDEAHDPSTPDKQCPGYLGQVNGKTVCVGTADKPLPPPQGNEPSRETGGAPDKANPAAGTKPATGEGSGNTGAGRTPTSGNGGNAGGPASAAGSRPDGTVDKPTDEKKEQQNCGAPGQPKCGIDETGTPARWGEDKWDSKISEYRNKANQSLNQIKESAGETFNPFKEFFFAPPLAACEPIDLPDDRGQITRHCEVVEGVRSIMAYLWALAALYLCLGWIKKATA